MMKKRLIPFILAVVMLFSIAATSYSAGSSYLDGYEYILPKEYYDYPEFEWEVEHGLAYLPGTVTGAANLWYRYEGHKDGEVWPQEYLDVYKGYMDSAELGSEGFTLYGYEWKKGKLFVDFGAAFDVKYYWQTGNACTELYGPTADDYRGMTNHLTVAVTNKNDGSLVRMVSTDDTFIPELRYDEYNSSYSNGRQFLSLEEAKAFEESKGMELEYTTECRKTVEISLPEDFDPEKHEFKFFNYVIDYYPDGDYESPPSDTPLYYVSEPEIIDVRDYIYGDANKDGRVNLSDVILMLKYAAKWSSVGIEYPNDGDIYEEYHMMSIILVLKMIAGWEESFFSDPHTYYGFEKHAAVRYYYK